MAMNQHFKKRKSRTSSASAVRRLPTLPSLAPVDPLASTSTTTVTDALIKPDASTDTSLTTTTTTTANESANLAAALTALQVSLKRDFESFTPPTPAVSPVHRTSAKRARFDFPGVDDCEPVPELQGKVNPAPKARGALLAVSTRIKFELEKHLRKNSERSQRPRKRKQLSYFAIIGAFHQAAHERDVCSRQSTTTAALDVAVSAAGEDRR